jgi:hypothetical protein
VARDAARSSGSDLRVESTETCDDVAWFMVARRRVRYPDLPLRRLGVGLHVVELAAVLAGLPADERRAATALLTQGLGRWRRWSTIMRRPPRGVDLRLAERDLVPLLLRAGALQVRHRYDEADDAWRLDGFRTNDVHRDALGRPDPTRLVAALEAELTRERPRVALAAGKPDHIGWDAFAFVLRAADQYLDFAEHDAKPQDRELAALVWHSKAFTARRAELVAEIVGVPVGELFEPRARQLRVDGELIHPKATIWADAVHDLPLEHPERLIGVLCVENSRTFEALRPFAARGWLVIEIPGQSPTAEVVLLSRVAALAPAAPIYAAFDPDPAGVLIALSLAERADVILNPALMGADALVRARRLDLAPADHKALAGLAQRALGPHANLVDAIVHTQRKGEQESIHPWLRERLDALTRELTPAAGR